MSKYFAKKCEYNGIKFDSKRERDRYIELLEMQNNCIINSLEVHPKYLLMESFKTVDRIKNRAKTEREINYIPDFRYIQDHRIIVEDVKSKWTRTAEYMIKRKLFLKKYPDIEFYEIY